MLPKFIKPGFRRVNCITRKLHMSHNHIYNRNF